MRNEWRAAFILELAAEIPATARRVAVDGVDGAGKTVFAGELGDALEARGRPVIRASVDGFHRPRVERYARGAGSPLGYFEDSYDYDALRSALLDPLAPGGSGRVRRAVFDHATDRPVDAPVEVAAADAVLVLDGIFLHRDELAGLWDWSVWLDVDPDTAQARCVARDGPVAHPERYRAGQRIYIDRCRPAERATVVVDNGYLAAPRRVR